MNIVEFSERELNSILATCQNSSDFNIQKAMNNSILEIVKTFNEQHYSGYTATYCLNILDRLLNYKPITPLTGEDDEWEAIDFDENIKYQNKRCPQIFKDKNNNTFNVEGKIFSYDNGHTWTSTNESSIDVSFPYVVPNSPEKIIVDTSKQRQPVFQEIAAILENILQNHPIEINEDSDICNYLNVSEFNVFEKELGDTFGLTDFKLNKDVDENSYLVWQVINDVLSHCE